MSLREDYQQATRPWRQQPKSRLRAELLALGRCFVPHPDNNNFRKLTLLALMGVWTLATFQKFPTTPSFSTLLYVVLTALIFTIVGRQWGIEVSGLVPNVQLRSNNDSEED